MNRKGVILTSTVVIILIIVIAVWTINSLQRECRRNSDCGQDSYCSSNFQCNKIPVIERTPTIINNNYSFLSIAIIFLGLILVGYKLIPYYKNRPKKTHFDKLMKKEKKRFKRKSLFKNLLKKLYIDNKSLALLSFGAIIGAIIIIVLILLIILSS